MGTAFPTRLAGPLASSWLRLQFPPDPREKRVHQKPGPSRRAVLTPHGCEPTCSLPFREAGARSVGSETGIASFRFTFQHVFKTFPAAASSRTGVGASRGGWRLLCFFQAEQLKNESLVGGGNVPTFGPAKCRRTRAEKGQGFSTLSRNVSPERGPCAPHPVFSVNCYNVASIPLPTNQMESLWPFFARKKASRTICPVYRFPFFVWPGQNFVQDTFLGDFQHLGQKGRFQFVCDPRQKF